MPYLRSPFAWKFSWFMTGFYSMFYNRPGHFCQGLVVAVVMPQYSTVAPLQRAFCSHAPQQKHRVTSLASRGKGGPAGLFFSPPALFSSSYPLRLFPSTFFFFLQAFWSRLEIYTHRWWDENLRAGERAMPVIQVWRVVFQRGLSRLSWRRWMRLWKRRCIGGDQSASGPTLLCRRDPPVGEAVRTTAGGPTEKGHKFQRENQ